MRIRVFFAAVAVGCIVGCSSPETDRSAPSDAVSAETPETAAPTAPPPDVRGPQGAPGPGDDLLGELRKEMTLAEKEAHEHSIHYFKTGMGFYNAFDYVEAAKHFQKSVDADPTNKEAQLYLHNAQLFNGDRMQEFRTSAERLAARRQARVKQERIELVRLFQEGEKLFEQNEFDRAISKFEQVLEKVKWFPYDIDDGDYDEQASQYVVQAKALKRDQRLAEREEQERIAFDEAMQEESASNARDRSKLRDLISRANDELTVQKYDKAERSAKEILAVDPSNQEAARIMEMARTGRHLYKAAWLHDMNAEQGAIDTESRWNVAIPYLDKNGVSFPPQAEWEMSEGRQRGIAGETADEPEWVKNYKKTLKTRKITLDFQDETAFNDVLEFLQNITGLNITLSPDIDGEELMLAPLTLQDIILESAMTILLKQVGMAMSFQDETLLITEPEEAMGVYYLDIYDVQDILSVIPDFPGPRIQISGDSGGGSGAAAGSLVFDDDDDEKVALIDPDQLVELITSSTGEDLWNDPSSMEPHRGQLIVNQTREISTLR